MIFNLKQERDEISADVLSLRKKVVTVLWELATDLGDIAEDTAGKTILNSSQKGFQRRTGQRLTKGLDKVQRSQKARGFSVSVFLWSMAGNLFENFKERKRVRLYAPLKKYFERQAMIDQKLNQAHEEFTNEQ